MQLSEVDAMAVTQGPGLVGALLVGITYGKTLAAALKKPLIPVNHLEGHVHAVFLEAHSAGRKMKFPAVCLIVSGGHTVLYEVTETQNYEADDFKPLSYRKIGQTRDDAAGEAYDKVAKLLALGYPGGPILDRLSVTSNGAGDSVAPPVRFGPTKMSGNALDFSFSGLKTAVLYHLREHTEYSEDIRVRQAALERGDNSFEKLLPLCDGQTLALIREFQRSVVRTLVEQTMAAAEIISAESILVSGGVAANSELRSAFEKRVTSSGMEVFFPSRALSTDNAAMIAAAAYSRFRAGLLADTSLNPDPALILK
jgi:N6-L-threonylcarbamoyladenine synthase